MTKKMNIWNVRSSAVTYKLNIYLSVSTVSGKLSNASLVNTAMSMVWGISHVLHPDASVITTAHMCYIGSFKYSKVDINRNADCFLCTVIDFVW